MLKIPEKWSVRLSIGLAVVLLVACVAGAFVMPAFVAKIAVVANATASPLITPAVETGILALGYLALAIVAVAGVLLLLLLWRVRQNRVFTPGCVALIRGISWCCYLLAGVFLGLGMWFYLSLVASFMVGFLGLCLRVVKNVIEEAIRIKDENDLTV